LQPLCLDWQSSRLVTLRRRQREVDYRRSIHVTEHHARG
jgi:hypothetical protein